MASKFQIRTIDLKDAARLLRELAGLKRRSMGRIVDPDTRRAEEIADVIEAQMATATRLG